VKPELKEKGKKGRFGGGAENVEDKKGLLHKGKALSIYGLGKKKSVLPV